MLPAFDPLFLFNMLMALGALSGVGALALALLRRDKQSAHLKAITERRRALATQTTEQMRAKARLQPKKKSLAEDVVEKFKLLQADNLRDIKRKLAAAGWRDPSAPAKFIAATLGLPIALGLLALLYTSGEYFNGMSFFEQILAAVAAAAFGFFIPRILLKNAVDKRRFAIQRHFPNALDLLVICVEAGLSAEAAFNRVTEEMVSSSPELAEEFGLVAAELAFLPERRSAYENLSERIGLPAVKSLATTLLQSEKYGTPLASGLRVLSDENRSSRMAAAEKKAASLPAKLTVPMIVFFLPVLFAVIIGPVAIQISMR